MERMQEGRKEGKKVGKNEIFVGCCLYIQPEKTRARGKKGKKRTSV